MKKAGRVLLILVGAIVGCAAIILLAVNLYVQSHRTQARIQQELGQRLGTTLRIQRMSVTPWGGLKLSGITIPQVSGGPGAEFLEAKTFRLRIHFASLFSRRLVIKEISLIDPSVVWLQNADGKWRIPPPQEKRTLSVPGDHRRSVPVASPNPMEPPVVVTSPPNEATAEEIADTPSVPEIRRVNLIGGRLHFLDEKSRVVANFEDVQFHSNFRDAAAVKGTIAIGKTSLRDRFFLQQLQSRLEYGPRTLELTDVKAKAGGGEVNGKFSMEPETPESPFIANVNFRDIQADQIVSEAGGPAGVLTGKLEGFLNASGKTADANALAGAGEIQLHDGELRRYSVLEALGQVLQIEELRQLRLDDAHVKYRVSPGVVTVDELVLHSANLRLSATGTISFDGKLQLASRLAINEKVRKQLFRAIRDNFQPIDEPGFAAVDFEIGGTVERPKSNLMSKVIGRDLNDLGGVISSLFGGGKAEKPKKKPKTETASPPPTGAVDEPSPTP